MASESHHGSIPDWTVTDANHAMVVLSFVHHWRATVQQTGDTRRIEVTLTHGGRRVTASSRVFVTAVNAALTKLQKKVSDDQPKLRLSTE